MKVKIILGTGREGRESKRKKATRSGGS